MVKSQLIKLIAYKIQSVKKFNYTSIPYSWTHQLLYIFLISTEISGMKNQIADVKMYCSEVKSRVISINT